MSSLAVPDSTKGGTPVSADQLAEPVRTRIRQGLEHRRPFEGNWALNMAAAAGDHWRVWDNELRTIRRIQETDPRYRNRELCAADSITEYRTTALGELGADNDRPQLLLQREDEAAEQYQEQLNRAVGYGWNYEWHGDEVLAEVDQYLVDLGTCAVRCIYDPTVGPVKADNVPHMDGKPLLDMGQATQAVAGAAEQGQTLEFKPIKQGRICWQAISPLGLITPPGVTHEKKFPWEAIVRPVYLPDVQEQYGDKAQDLKEDNNIRSDLGLTSIGSDGDLTSWGTGSQKNTRLRDHIWVYTYYERPSHRYPKGRVMTLGGARMKVLDYQEQLPYLAPDGTYRAGIAYFHWWRATGRFWSRSLVDVMRDPARGIDKRRTQINELIDRSMPYVFVQENSKANQRTGLPYEMIPLGPGETPPLPVQGIPPGPWMQADVEALREDLDHATGISAAQRGENPAGVTTYSQLALMKEADVTKRDPIRQDRHRSVDQLIEDSISDMRTYWGPERQIMLAGDDEQASAEIFNATKIPTFFIVDHAKGAPKPRTQGDKLALVTDIFNASVAAAQPLPIRWLKESLESGEPQELPADQGEDPAEKAELENHLMINTGTPMPIAYYDQAPIHLPIHRRAQDQAMFTGNQKLWQLIDQHCQLHMNAALAQQQAVLDQQQHTQVLGQMQQQGPPAQNGQQPQPQPQPAGPPAAGGP